MTWPGLLILVAMGAIAVLWWLNRPTYHRDVPSSGFERYFAAWLPQMANGGLIFIREDKSKHFVQFGLYKNAMDAVLQFGLPDAAWSSTLFDVVRSALQRAGFKVELESTKTEGVQRFLICDLPATNESVYPAAAELARVAFAAMGHDHSTRFTVWSQGDLDPKGKGVKSLGNVLQDLKRGLEKGS